MPMGRACRHETTAPTAKLKVFGAILPLKADRDVLDRMEYVFRTKSKGRVPLVPKSRNSSYSQVVSYSTAKRAYVR